jgi:hypothetical protein
MGLVGARPLVHSRQFNGKQEGVWTTQHPCACAAPATVKRTVHPDSPRPTQPLKVLNKPLGRRTQVVFASPDTGQQGARASNPEPYRPCTVGEGGEDTVFSGSS